MRTGLEVVTGIDGEDGACEVPVVLSVVLTVWNFNSVAGTNSAALLADGSIC